MNPHVSHDYLYPYWVCVPKKVSKKSEGELDLRNEESSLNREEKAFLVEETAITKISRLKKETNSLRNYEQFIQARTQSREWQEMRLER